MQMTAEQRIKARRIPSGYTEYERRGDNVVFASPDCLHAMAYRGKSGKHDWYFRFRSPAELAETVKRFFEKCDVIKQYADSRKADRKAFKTALIVGDILETSWGYDQTNVEFYQVLTVHNNTVTIREVKQNYKESGYMSGHTMPIRDAFLNDSKILTKRVQSGEHVKINESATAWKWDGKECFTSSYA